MRELRYGIVASPLGELVVGAGDAGCCLVEYLDRGGLPAIRSRIERRYRGRLVEGECDLLTRVRDELREYFAGGRRAFTFPLDLQGSPFERAVWAALLSISYGRTATYGEIARAAGRPLAARAVGRANGANPLAIVVPCHRVVERGGGLRGYGGGAWRKRVLLELEAGSATRACHVISRARSAGSGSAQMSVRPSR
jgi:AraC family transcriptional regulator of adaptative response/methylated-DNA-[protein]-cysteine methyltransferase